MKYVLALLAALLLACLCGAADPAIEAQVALALAKQAPRPPQAPPVLGCTCSVTGECSCDVCRCAGRKQLTSDIGTKVWFKLVNGQWVPDEPGWQRRGDFWYRTPSPVMLQHQSMMPSYYPMPSFGGGRGGC